MRTIIGVDLGGTHVRVGRIEAGQVAQRFAMPISAAEGGETVLQEIAYAIAQVFTAEVKAIGVGVPSLVDASRGIVYEVQNIVGWQEIPLSDILEDRFQVPVRVNNDVNCFVLGERFFGKGKDCHHLLGIAIGTGIGAGLWLNEKLYAGRHCGAGEIGMMPYRDATYEHYCSGQFFKNRYRADGQQVYEAALRGDAKAIGRFQELGSHLGQLMLAALYAFDPEMIILGGSISQTYPLFQEAMWQQIHTFAYKSALQDLRLEVSELPDVTLLGASLLCAEI